MKLKRSLFIVLSFLFMVFALTVITSKYVIINASEEVTVQAPKGARIRTTGKAGIKFEASIGLDQTYPEGSEHGFFVAKGVHAYEDVKEAASNGESKVNGNNLINQKLTGTNKKFSVVVVNFEGDTDEANIDRFTTDLTVLPYVKLSDGTYIFPEDLCTRNIGQVAKQTSESNGYLGNELINKIVNLVGGQYLQIDESLVNEEVNVYVKSGLTANRSKYFINGKYYENVKFYGDINEALQTEVNNPVISLLDEEYNEDIQITKEVKLIGNNAVINGVVTIDGANVVIDSATLTQAFINTNPVNNLTITNSNVAGEYLESYKRTDLTEVYFTLACWDLDPEDYAVSTEATEYTVEHIADSQLTYVYVKITASEGYFFTEDVKVYVNGSLVKVSLYKVNSTTEIMFTMDDPNWTDIY